MLLSLILKLAIFPHLPTMGMDNNTYYTSLLYIYILSFITINYYSLVFIIVHYCTMLYHLREGWKYKTIRGFEAEVINQSQVFNGPALATALDLRRPGLGACVGAWALFWSLWAAPSLGTLRRLRRAWPSRHRLPSLSRSEKFGSRSSREKAGNWWTYWWENVGNC